MAFGVFIHRQDSIYDDSPAERYQFPRQYLGRVQACIGDWIIYYAIPCLSRDGASVHSGSGCNAEAALKSGDWH